MKCYRAGVLQNVFLISVFSIGTFSLAAQTNDVFIRRAALVGRNASTTNFNLTAFRELGEPNHAGNPGGKSLWWTWTAPDNEHVVIDTAGSSFNTLLAVYTGSSVSALTEVSSNDNDEQVNEPTSRVEFEAQAGNIYQIAVDGEDGDAGQIKLSLHMTPINDLFANRIPLFGTNVSVSGENFRATLEPEDPILENPNISSVWWTWTAPTDGTVLINTFGSDFRSVLMAYTGDSLATLEALPLEFETLSDKKDRLSFDVPAGTVYQILVADSEEETGNITLNLNLVPNNDSFASRRTVTNGTTILIGHNINATKENTEPNHADEPGGASVWWSWTAPTNGSIAVDTVDSQFDTVLAVYTGATISDLTLVASNDDGEFLENGFSRVAFDFVAGTTYHFAADGRDGATGQITLNFNSIPHNDLFANREILSGNPIHLETQNMDATKDEGEPDPAEGSGTASLWWSWMATNNGTVLIDTAGSQVGTILAVYTGDVVSNLTLVASNIQSESANDNRSEVRFDVTAGTIYQIVVDGMEGDLGKLSLNLNVAPENDLFANRAILSGTNLIVTSSNAGAGTEEFENTDGSSVWWEWTAPVNGVVSIDTTSSDFSSRLAVFTGNSLDDLLLVSDEFTRRAKFSVQAGTAYQIAVSGNEAATGNITLNLELIRSNDLFADRRILSGENISNIADNTDATTELNEPVHGENSMGASLWWSWTAPKNGRVIIDTLGADNETILAVYTGNEISALALIAQDDPYQGEGDFITRVEFNVVAGSVYQIATDSMGQPAEIRLNINLAPVNDRFADRLTLSGSNFSVVGSNIRAGRETDEPEHAGEMEGASVWWTWTAPSDGIVMIDSSGSTFAPTIAVYKGDSLSALVPVASDLDDPYDETDSVSQVLFVVQAGDVFQIAVDGSDGKSGLISLNFDLSSEHDAFADRKLLSGENFAAIGYNLGASRESGEPNPSSGSDGKSVWWTWTAPASGTLILDILGSDYGGNFGGDFSTLMAIYTGNALSNLTLVTTDNFTHKAIFDVTAGTTYQISVETFEELFGRIKLNFELVKAVTAVSPLLDSPSLLPNGQFQFQVVGNNGGSIIVETSTNLATWHPVSTNVLNEGSATFQVDVSESSQQYFRVVTP